MARKFIHSEFVHINSKTFSEHSFPELIIPCPGTWGPSSYWLGMFFSKKHTHMLNSKHTCSPSLCTVPNCSPDVLSLLYSFQLVPWVALAAGAVAAAGPVPGSKRPTSLLGKSSSKQEASQARTQQDQQTAGSGYVNTVTGGYGSSGGYGGGGKYGGAVSSYSGGSGYSGGGYGGGYSGGIGGG